MHLAFRLFMTSIMIVMLSLTSLTRAADKPNILVIWGDDVGWNNPSCYNSGMMGYQTPNIDRIAREGVRMTD